MSIFRRRIADLYRDSGLATNDFLTLLSLSSKTESYTYRQVVDTAIGWSNFYRQKGLRSGNRILVILPHSLDLYTSYLGACLGGFCPAMLHFPSAKFSRDAYAETVQTLIQKNGAELVLTYNDLQNELVKILPSSLGSKILSISSITSCGIEPHAPFEDDQSSCSSEPLFIQYSSGTIGLKKGVGISEHALDWQISTYADSLGITDKDVIVSWLPLYHDMGLITSYFLPLLTGTRLVAMSPFDWVRNPGMLLDAIAEYRGTYSWMPNFAYFHIASNIKTDSLKSINLSSLRAFINCSEPVTKSAHDALCEALKRFGFRENQCGSCYAMAETTFAISSTSPTNPIHYEYVDEQLFTEAGVISPSQPFGPKTRILASSGCILPGTEVTILDSKGAEVGEGIIGEIQVRSQSLVSGYCGDAEDRSAFSPSGFLTGDLGYLSNGHLFVTGRLKDLIIINGKNLYPHDIEKIVGDLPNVIQGRVVAVGSANTDQGTEDLVILAESHLQEQGELVKLQTLISSVVAGAIDVVPKKVAILPHLWLRKSSSGKLSRKINLDRYNTEFPELLAAQSTIQTVHASTSPTIEGIAQILSSSATNSAMNPSLGQLQSDTKLLSSGILDSLGLIKFIVALEKAFAISITEELHSHYETHFETIGSVLDLVKSLQATPLTSEAIATAALHSDQELPLRGLSDRAFKFSNYLSSTKTHDLLIFGNSRCFPMHSSVAAKFGYNSYNFAVSNATVSDLLCYFHLVVQNGKQRIRRIIVSVEPSFFSGADSRLIAIPELANLVPRNFDQSLYREEENDLLSTLSDREQELLASQRSFDHAPRFYTYCVEHGDQLGISERLVDITLNQRSKWKMSADAGDYRATLLMMYPKPPPIDLEAIKRFACFLSLCKVHSIQVDCFYPPLHHSLIEFAAKETGFMALRNEISNLLSTKPLDVKIHDFLYPIAFGGDDEDFSDAGHMMAYNADLILKRLLENGGENNLK